MMIQHNNVDFKLSVLGDKTSFVLRQDHKAIIITNLMLAVVGRTVEQRQMTSAERPAKFKSSQMSSESYVKCMTIIIDNEIP